MKKQKLIKVTASMDLPVGLVGTAVPAGYNGEVAIIFEGKDLGLYGFDGSSWSLIHRYQAGDIHYLYSGGMERYYVMSFAGQEEAAKLSFFSTGNISSSIPRISSTLEETKLQDINEVPPYTAGDENKMLTVLSDGSLAWLLSNQNYIVDADGNYGETIIVPTFSSSELEEQGTITGSATIVNGVLVCTAGGQYTSMPNSAEFKSSTNQSMSFWFKSSYTPASGAWMRFLHTHVIGGGSNGFFLEMRSPTKFYFKGASHGLLADGDPTATSPYALNDGQWHHVALAWSVVGSNQIKMWVDGQPITVHNQGHVGAGTDGKSTLFIGARQFASPMQIDKVDIKEEFIDDAEVLNRYNAGVSSRPA